MNKDFPRIISLLRTERKLSQKQVAADLEISQALLSHYEKGIRECGLDFLVKVASYYNVSCDYLLGRSPERQGATASLGNMPELVDDEVKERKKRNMMAQLNKKLIVNTTSVIFDMVAKASNKKLTNAVSAYLSNANYIIFRKLYSANEESSQAMFSIPLNQFGGYSKATMEIEETKLDILLNGEKEKELLKINPEIIEKTYPKEASSLFNLIQNTEKSIGQNL